MAVYSQDMPTLARQAYQKRHFWRGKGSPASGVRGNLSAGTGP